MPHPHEQVDQQSGFTEGERRCHDALLTAFEEFQNLPSEHPHEMEEFARSVHQIQGLLAIRVARRAYPDYWPRYGDTPRSKK